MSQIFKNTKARNILCVLLGTMMLVLGVTVAQSVIYSDTDADGMDDGWETANFGDLSHDGTDDGDVDTLPDKFEFEAGLNPNAADSDNDGQPDWIGIPGYLSVQRWDNISGTNIDQLTDSQVFYGTPSAEYFVAEAKTSVGSGDQFGLRMRGTVIAPYTGEYRFWVAGDDYCVLYLSSDSRRFKRRPIAYVNGYTAPEQWGKYASQRSEVIDLVAGEEYYIEVLMKEGGGSDHLAVAWEYFGQARQVIPGANLRSYVPDADDQDDDGMSDLWELSVGLDPNDNGQMNINQRAYADNDGDGIANWEEYYYGGTPFQVGGNQGFLEFDVWKGITGVSVSDLVYNSKFTGPADGRTWTRAETGNWGDNYGGRMRGTVTAPVTGDYTFWVAGDDNVELWLSDSESRFGKKLVAYHEGYTGPRQWEKYTTQKSASYRLQAGQKYYIEALVKDLGGADHLSIGWDCLPVPAWSEDAVGDNVTATWTENGGVVSVTAEAGDIWGSADRFAYRSHTLDGDGVVTARIAEMNNPYGWAKVGLMFRETLDANSKHALVCRSGAGRLAFQSRAETGGASASQHTDTSQLANWVRIERTGDVFKGYYSEDGLNWTFLGERTIVMPQVIHIGFAATDNTGADPVVATIDNFSVSVPGQAGLIPSSALTSILPDANDLDDDNLPDDWETQVGLNATTAANGQGQYGDPDGDRIDNYHEYLLGSDPLQAGGVPGYLMREVWYNIGGGHVNDLTGSGKFLLLSDLAEPLASTEAPSNHADYYGQRIRGRVVAPVTGYYRFWIAGDDGSELWLSSDSRKFNKRRISWIRKEGVFDELADFGWTEPQEWDLYLSQRSESFYFEAGQEYFLEILHKERTGDDHVAVAWQYTDANTGQTFDRELIPATQLRSFGPDADDSDDDYLPDSWETEYGLDPADNGYVDSRQGEYGDYDNDLLINHEEWLQGTDPTNADSDGDGVDDYTEIHAYGSDPSKADIGAHVLVDSATPSSFATHLGDWGTNADGSITSLQRRGKLTYTLTAATAGVHILEVAGRTAGTSQATEYLPIKLAIDGIYMGSYQLVSRNGGQGLVEGITPWLTAGSHTLEIVYDNHVAGRFLQIDSVKLLQPGGIDENGNGTPDWLERQLVAENAVTVCPQESLVSPACIEGKARYFGQFAVSSAGLPLIADKALGYGWYVNVPLSTPLPDEDVAPTPVDFSFEDGSLALQQQITWKETDVLTVGDLTIRKGDSLRLTALPDLGPNDPHSIKVTLTINGNVIATDYKAANPHVYTFDAAGDYTVQVDCRHGNTKVEGSIVVTVLDADFGEPFEVFANRSRNWEVPGVGNKVFVEHDPRLGFVEVDPSAEGYRTFRVDTFDPVERRVLARTEVGGAIIDHGVVEGYQVYSTSQTGDVNFVQTFSNGDRIVRMSIVAPYLPEGAYIKLKIFVSGVTFLDGTKEKVLTAADFDSNGVLYIDYNFPAGTTTSACHRLYLYDADDNLIGQR